MIKEKRTMETRTMETLELAMAEDAFRHLERECRKKRRETRRRHMRMDKNARKQAAY